jgi:hypothetical protein
MIIILDAASGHDSYILLLASSLHVLMYAIVVGEHLQCEAMVPPVLPLSAAA